MQYQFFFMFCSMGTKPKAANNGTQYVLPTTHHRDGAHAPNHPITAYRLFTFFLLSGYLMEPPPQQTCNTPMKALLLAPQELPSLHHTPPQPRRSRVELILIIFTVPRCTDMCRNFFCCSNQLSFFLWLALVLRRVVRGGIASFISFLM